jgi:hypothetical protein
LPHTPGEQQESEARHARHCRIRARTTDFKHRSPSTFLWGQCAADGGNAQERPGCCRSATTEEQRDAGAAEGQRWAGEGTVARAGVKGCACLVLRGTSNIRTWYMRVGRTGWVGKRGTGGGSSRKRCCKARGSYVAPPRWGHRRGRGFGGAGEGGEGVAVDLTCCCVDEPRDEPPPVSKKQK